MKNKTTHTRTLSPQEAGELIKKAIGAPAHAQVDFRVEGHNEPDDWRAEYGLDYQLRRVSVTWDEQPLSPLGTRKNAR